MIYLDHAATTKINPDILNFLMKSLETDFANPSSGHKLGKNLKSQIDQLRIIFLKQLGANSYDHFYFTSSATESNNTVIKGLRLESEDIVIYSKADHKSVVNPIESLQIDHKEKNIKLVDLKHLENGEINWQSISIDSFNEDKVKLIVFSLVNNQSGNINSIDCAIELKKRFKNAHVHIDAVQALGKISFKVNPSIDSMSVTSHKIHGPKNVAGLYLKKAHKVRPLLIGGGQQDDFRSSTESYSFDAAFAKAFEHSLNGLEKNFIEVQKLNLFLKEGLKKINSDIIFPFENTSPYILCFILKGLSSDIIIRHLETKDVYISSTSACSSKIKGYNSTLDALKIPEKYHKNVLRISLSCDTSQSEIDDFLAIFHALWSEIRHLVK